MSTEVAEATAFKAMQTDIQVSMDDVVSAFVSQYENNLYARKKELGAAIKAEEATLEDINKVVLDTITGESFEAVLPLGLKCTVGKGELDWGNGKVNFKITIEEASRSQRYNNTITLLKTRPIPKPQIKARETVRKGLEALRSDLGEVLVSLKSVARKERQVRGRIAIRKLEDSGYANLMQDEELVQLVQLDD